MSGRAACLLAGLLAVAPALAESPLVYASNYEVVLEADGGTRQIRSRARVRDGHAIPVEFGRHKLDIKVSSADEQRIEIELLLFEESAGTWFRVNAEELSFLAQLEAPVEFNWAGAGMELDLALIVSVYRP